MAGGVDTEEKNVQMTALIMIPITDDDCVTKGRFRGGACVVGVA